jgi:hypothetical protein
MTAGDGTAVANAPRSKRFLVLFFKKEPLTLLTNSLEKTGRRVDRESCDDVAVLGCEGEITSLSR